MQRRLLALVWTMLALATLSAARAQDAAQPPTPAPTEEQQHLTYVHPALFLVGDSIMKTGAGNGDQGPWGWGSEIGAFFDPAKIHEPGLDMQAHPGAPLDDPGTIRKEMRDRDDEHEN